MRPTAVPLPKGESQVTADADVNIRLAVSLAHALQHFGAPAHRLEEACVQVCNRLGLEAQFFSTPTAVFAAFGQLDAQRTYLLRVNSGDVHLENLSHVDWIIQALLDGQLDAESAVAQLDSLDHAPRRWGTLTVTLCFALASGSAARILGGGLYEIASSIISGLLVGLLVWISGHWKAIGNVLMPVSAITVSAVAALAASIVGSFAVHVAILAGLIVLVPGLSFTTAMVELATGHLASGTGRLANATSMFLLMAFGMALGSQLGRVFPPELGYHAVTSLPLWSEWVALAVATLAFSVLFRALPRDIGWICLACTLSYYAARFGSGVFGPELGGFVASFQLGILSNLFARVINRPAAIMLEPGMVLLVPGTIGLKSITAMLENDPMRGLDTAFSMLLIAIALVIGLLFANVVFPPRRTL